MVLINGVYEWAIKEGFLEEVSLSGALKKRCGERLTPGRPPTSVSFAAAVSVGGCIHLSNRSVNVRHPWTVGSQFCSSLCYSECSVKCFQNG